MKDNPDQDSWFSAKPMWVGDLKNILEGTELCSLVIYIYKYILNISGDLLDFIGK